MINVRLTTTNGETKNMSFGSSSKVQTFIEKLETELPLGYAVNVDAPLIGIHSGWVIGKKE
jgi:hypothetical protein